MRLTTEFRVEGFEGKGGGSEEVEVAVVDVVLEEAVEVPGVADRAAIESAKRTLQSACEDWLRKRPTCWGASFPWLWRGG